MNKFNLKAAIFSLLLFSSFANAQSNPGLTYGQVPTAAQWNSYFAAKQDVLGYTPLNVAGGQMLGPLVLAPSNTSNPGLTITPGVAPLSPTNGAMWSTSAGLFVQINGSTVGPLVSSASITLTVGTTPISGGTSGRVLYQTGSVLGQMTTSGSGTVLALAASPTISSPTFSGTVAGAGTIPNSVLANSSVTIGSTSTALGATSATIAGLTLTSPTFSGTVAGAGTIPNSVLVNASTTVNGQTCTLGSTCTITATAGTITSGVTAVSGSSANAILFNNASVLGSVTTANSGVLITSGGGVPSISSTLPSGISATSMNLTTPTLGVAAGTSLALNGCTVGSNALCTTGAVAISSTVTSAAHAITSASANALSAGVNGATAPAFNVDASTASSATGINIKSAAATSGVALSVISSGTNESLTIDAKGSGTVTVGGTSTGSIVLNRATSIAGLTVTGSFTATGLVTNASLANSSVTVNGATCTLGASCVPPSTLVVGSSLVNSGSNGFILYNNAGILGNLATTGTGSVVLNTSSTISGLTVTSSFTATGLVTSAALASTTGSGTTVVLSGGPTFTGSPVLSTPTATSIAIGGCTIGSNAFCVTGTAAISSSLTSGSIGVTGTTTVTSASASALTVGLNGATNPAFQVDASTASQAAGLKVTGAATGGTVAIAAIDSGSNASLTINGKGTGTIGIGSVSTGAVTITPATSHLAPVTVTSASAAALSIGLNGATNPAFQVDNSTALQVAGLKITGAATGGTVALAATDSGSNANITINAKGAGTIGIGSVSTGGVNIVPALTHGATGSVVGVAAFANATSGTVTLQPVTGALGSSVLSLPAITDTLAGYSLANGGTNNALIASNGGVVYSDASKLNVLAGTSTAGLCLLSASNTAPTWGSCFGAAAVSSVANVDGTLVVSPTTGSVVASLDLTHANTWVGVQTFTTPVLGVATATTINKVAITAPATSATLTIANGKTLTASNSIALAGTDSTTMTFPSTSATITQTIASGAKALATGAIGSAACSSAQTDTATGAATTDAIIATFNGDPTAVTGYVPLTSGMLTIMVYPSLNTVNFKVCNNTGSSITPGAITLNWRVVR